MAINALMFAVEVAAGSLAGSQALKADALDFLADALTYGISLAAIGWGLRARARVAMATDLSLLLVGLWVLASTIWRIWMLGGPRAGVMGVVGALTLLANAASVLILMRWRDGDANVRSAWPCSRIDAVGNVAVMAAAGAVAWTGTAWPDLLVAGLMAALFLSSAAQIVGRARAEAAHAAGGLDAAALAAVTQGGCCGPGDDACAAPSGFRLPGT